MITEVPYCQFCGQYAVVEKYRWKPCCKDCLKRAEINDYATLSILIEKVRTRWSKYNNTPEAYVINSYFKFTLDLLNNFYSENTSEKSS